MSIQDAVKLVKKLISNNKFQGNEIWVKQETYQISFIAVHRADTKLEITKGYYINDNDFAYSTTCTDLSGFECVSMRDV